MCMLNPLWQQTKTIFKISKKESPVWFEAGDFLFYNFARQKQTTADLMGKLVRVVV